MNIHESNTYAVGGLGMGKGQPYQSWWQIETNTEQKKPAWSFQNWLLAILNFLVDVNFTDRNRHRPGFQLETPVKFKTGAVSWISDLTMSYLVKRLTIEQSQNLKKSIIADFGVILGPEYAKKISGKMFDNYNASLEFSIQSYEFKVMFTDCRSFWTNLQTRYNLTNY